MSQKGDQPQAAISAESALQTRNLHLEVTPDTIVALRRPPSLWPAFVMAILVLVISSPIIYSGFWQFSRKGWTDYVSVVALMLFLLLGPVLWVLIATLRRRKLDRGIRLEMGTFTVYTPDEAVGLRRVSLSEIAQVSVGAGIGEAIGKDSQNWNLVFITHYGAKLTVIRQCQYDELQLVAKAIYPRIRQPSKGFEVVQANGTLPSS